MNAPSKIIFAKSIKITGAIIFVFFVLMALLVLGIFFFIKPPDQFEPIAWQPSPAFIVDPTKVDRETTKLIKPLTFKQELNGPEDIAVNHNGDIFIGVADGNIMRIQPEKNISEPFAHLGGRPFGLYFDKNQQLIVANPGIGLQSISPDGKVSLLTDTVNGKKILFANDLTVAENGMIYFSDSNWKYNLDTLGHVPSYSIYDFLEGHPRGRLLQYDPKTHKTTELLSNLYFPNGVVVTSDQRSVLIAESTRYRITRYWLEGPKAGTSDIFLDNVPGIMDGFTRSSDGTLWLTLYDRAFILDSSILPYEWARQLLIRIPWLSTINGSPSGSVLIMSEKGEVLRYITNITPAATNIVEYKNQWLFGSLKKVPIRIMPK